MYDDEVFSYEGMAPMEILGYMLGRAEELGLTPLEYCERYVPDECPVQIFSETDKETGLIKKRFDDREE